MTLSVLKPRTEANKSSFRTGRYLGGPQGVEVRETRKLRIHNLQKESALAAVDRECLEIAAIYT